MISKCSVCCYLTLYNEEIGVIIFDFPGTWKEYLIKKLKGSLCKLTTRSCWCCWNLVTEKMSWNRRWDIYISVLGLPRPEIAPATCYVMYHSWNLHFNTCFALLKVNQNSNSDWFEFLINNLVNNFKISINEYDKFDKFRS